MLIKILFHFIFTKFYSFFYKKRMSEKIQQTKIQRFRKKVLSKSPYYKRYQNVPFDKIPIMTKNLMMENFNEINTAKLDRDQALKVAIQSEKSRDFTPTIDTITVGLSSGTSCNRGLFIVSRSERARWAGVMLAKVLNSSILKNHKISLFLRANSNLYETVNSNNIKFYFHDLKKTFELLIEEVNAVSPHILIAPALVLKTLAQHKKQGKLNIQPRKIYSCAEVLSKSDKEYMQKIFNQEIHQIYQCTEGFLGITCKYGSLHLNEEHIYVEKQYIDSEKRRFIPIITDLVRSSQPIVRYRLDDILIESPQLCPCGNPSTVIEHIEGRCDDIFLLPSKSNSNKLILIYPDFLQRAIICAESNIKEYRMIQHNYTEITVELLSKNFEKDCSIILNCINKLFDEFNCIQPKVKFERYIPQSTLVKFRRSVREFRMPESVL